MSEDGIFLKSGRAWRCALMAAWALVLLLTSAGAAENDTASAWWNGNEATGDWFGMRDKAKDIGLTIRSQWNGIFFGILASENGSGNAFPQEWAFGARWDLGTLSRWKTLNGLSAFGAARWRDSGPDINPNNLVGASRLFNPSRFSGGVGWRMLEFGLTYAAPGRNREEGPFTLTAGWLRPQREFIVQLPARLFANNAMASARGVGGNIPFSSSYSGWGGVLEVRPLPKYYTKAGLYMTYPDPTSPGNNGLMFRGVPPDNGLFAIGEAGFTPEVGPSALPGKYAFGGYSYGGGGENQYGFYGQAEQMLFRGGHADPLQGLRAFGLVTGAPEFNNRFPFYFQSGLVYGGLIPSRERDQTMVAVAFGKYSAATQPGSNSTTFMEVGYRIQVSGWSFLQPFAQYLVQPGGSPSVVNAAILGVFMGMEF